jgi:hypothetical protein
MQKNVAFMEQIICSGICRFHKKEWCWSWRWSVSNFRILVYAIEYIAVNVHGLENIKLYKCVWNYNSSDFNLVKCWPGHRTHCLSIDFLVPPGKRNVVLKLSYYLLSLSFTCFPIHYSLFTVRSKVFTDSESFFKWTVKKETYRVNLCYIISLYNRKI